MTPAARSVALDVSSDVELISSVGDVLAVPRVDPADSFVLHSALELCARAALLPFVDVGRRAEARHRIVEVADQFEAFGDPVPPPADLTFGSLQDGAAYLDAAIELGELDDVDAAARWLGRSARASDLAPLLATSLIPRLGAAGHAPIFLSLLPRAAPRGEITGELLRGLCRDLARHPTWRIQWIDEREADGQGAIGDRSSGELFRVLAEAPLLGRAASSFIYPLMSRVDTAQCAGSLLAAVTSGREVAERARVLTRVAAWSMLNEPGDQAPYGWSHCLTMPQAVMAIAPACADPSIALAVAATYVLGFRSSLADQTLDTSPEMLAGSELPEGSERATFGALATNASVHHDAHLVKYTLACIDAANDDPTHGRLYLAAAETLAGWWSAHPDR
jgi:hypothetical protein